jgi:hypothetical protein
MAARRALNNEFQARSSRNKDVAMIRLKHFFTPICACLALFCAVATATAQDEPIRLQKKAKPPEPPAAKPGEKDKDKAKGEEKPKAKSETLPGKADPKDELKTEDPDELEREVRETINRLSKNFRTVEDKLQKKDPGDGTQKVQKDIIKDLDELIEQTRKQEEQMQKEQSQERQQQQGQKSGQSKRQRMMQAQRNRQQRNRTAQRQQRPGQQQQNQLSRQQQQQQQQNDPQLGNLNLQSELESKRDNAPKTADLYKDIWGHLPETLRQEMTQYTREQFMPKYNELLKQYYATIAEKGRKPGDR